MNFTCKITPMGSNRIRLQMHDASALPEISQLVMEPLLGQPGILGIELRPAEASVIILHDGAPTRRKEILRTLTRGAEPTASTPSASTPSAFDGISNGDAEDMLSGGPSANQLSAESDAAGNRRLPDPLAVGAQSPYARCQLLHAMRGRVRLRAAVLKNQPELAGALTWRLSQQPGMRKVRLSPNAECIVVDYDPAQWNTEAVVDLITTYVPDAVAIEGWRAEQAAQRPDAALRRRRLKLELALAAGALAAGFILHLPALLVTALLLACAWSVLERTHRWFRKDRLLTVEAVAGTAMALLALFGMTWQAALIPAALFAFDYWRGRRAKAKAAAGAVANADVTVDVDGEAELSTTPEQPATVRIAKPVEHESTIPTGSNQTGANPLLVSVISGWAVWAAKRTVARPAKKAR